MKIMKSNIYESIKTIVQIIREGTHGLNEGIFEIELRKIEKWMGEQDDNESISNKDVVRDGNGDEIESN